MGEWSVSIGRRFRTRWFDHLTEFEVMVLVQRRIKEPGVEKVTIIRRGENGRAMRQPMLSL